MLGSQEQHERDSFSILAHITYIIIKHTSLRMHASSDASVDGKHLHLGLQRSTVDSRCLSDLLSDGFVHSPTYPTDRRQAHLADLLRGALRMLIQPCSF